jgi:hypothetical protein
MNVDRVLDTMNRHQVAYLLIGGVNFLLRHSPILTFDIDFWIEDTTENRRRCEAALAELDAQWGATDDDWGPVATRTAGWLERQALFCLTSPHGAIDIFRRVAGLDDWRSSYQNAVREQTSGGISYRGISDADMLRCQYALEEGERKRDRIAILEKVVRDERGQHGP